LWRLLDLEYEDPYKNMAVEEGLLTAIERSLSPNTLRVWRNENSVIIGRSQHLETEVDLEACRKYGTLVVRRFTGGGAVYQDRGNLNWTIIFRRNDIPFSHKNMFDIFNLMGEVIVECLKNVGLDAEFKSPNSVYVQGKKVSGMAAYCKRSSMLCHGTLLLKTDLTILSDVLSNKKFEVTTLEHELGKSVPAKYIKEILVNNFVKKFNVKIRKSSLSKEERKIVNSLFKIKYLEDKETFCTILTKGFNK